ncbi:receptor-type tyrosine-protein phosphatase delta-like isoform X16 [Syngnathus acus]|uniref:receptor-type tyrosine-protein phosphatase delta-like isoform X16 n=1 Tax=Syngnathus acus TaxID=161584 RepID=UPI0018860F35|nr:receptor-type tyrosine-protein phosphatase delta-like isoform X16 [Syngnathus acus]
MHVSKYPTMHSASPGLILLSFLFLADADSPPRFTRTPEDQTGVQGGVASFVCQAAGEPQPKIVWNKKGKKVSNQRFEVIEFDDGSGSVLRIQPLRTPRDEAIYECHASNSAGELTSSTRLSVLREDQLPSGFPTIDMGPQLKVVERSRTATMLCAASGNPDPEITWFKDFLPVNTSNNNGRIKQLRSESFGALQIEMSEESDQGKYECVATNSDGTRYSTPANLYVRELREVRRVPPRFSIPPADSEIMPGGNVNITCVAVGSPMPYVKWMLGAEDLTPEDDMPIGRNVLELTDVRQSNNYTCVAMSTLGVIEAVAQIIVKALPKAPGTPVVTERTATSITLTWDSGNPEPVSYYIIQHRSKGSEDPYKEIDSIATTRYSVGGLSPYSHYDFRVAAVNTIGQGPSSEVVEARTAEQAPSSPPRQVRGRMLSTTTAIIHWDEPEEPNGQVVGYRVYYTSDNMLPVNQWEKQMVRSANFITIQSLTPNKTYYIRVLAFTSVGDGPLSQDLQIIAKTGVPSQPSEFKGEAKSETSILLSWIAPPQGGPDNQITGYELVYRRADDTEEKKVSFEPTSSYLLRNLKPFSAYTFQLAARSKHGIGAYTNEISIDTPQTLFATNFKVKAAMKNSVLFSWEVRDKNPTQPFTILYGKGQSVEVDGKQTQKLITGLQPDTLYSFLLTNRANSAGGLQHRVTATTAPDILKSKPVVVGKTNADGMVTVQLPSVQTAAKVKGYYLVVVPLKKQRGGKFSNPWEDPDQMNLDELLKEINRTSVSRALRIRRQTGQSDPRAYVSAHFKALPPEFTLGDGQNYGDFRNRPLQNGQEYVFFVLALLDLSENTMFSTSPYSDPVMSSGVDPQPIVDEEEGLLWVVGPVLAVIFIVCIVIAILLFKRKRAEAEGRKGSFPCSKAMSSHHPTDPVELRRINFQTPAYRVSVYRGYRRLSSMTSHPPVPVSELADNIERLKANDNLKFSQEYESIDPGQQFTWENSNLEVNKPKNRYANVIAYDHSRVILSGIEGVPGSDYINANYIDGYRRQNAYIATQGSLPETFGDFWRMVWEQHTANIIMMTKLEEKSRMPSYFFSKVKCDQYWPTRGTETYGLIQVTLLDTVELATYSVRTFALYKSGSNEKREVRHFQFTAWPDHGVPEHPTPFLAFLRRVKACNPADAGPMIVHCSAGVGRTGCFIVIDAMAERIKHEKTVDIYGHVTLMRSQRNYMVQTEDQYIFIYDALLEAVTCGNTEVAARNLYSYIQRLTQIEPGDNVTGMELEFKRLASAKAHTSRFVSANLPCNKFKNKLVNIMPYETTRVPLQPIRGVEGSDYINASFIDGYRQQKAYIATQGPLAETTEDYWRMLWEHNSTIVVMLTKLREMGREKCHQYWPAERSARYQYFVVDPMAEYNMPQYILREFKVTDARDGQSRTVRQFQFTDWPEQGVPKSGEGFIDFIGQVHKTKEQFGQDGPITVHCSAGVGRTGVFITLSIVLERMRYEGVVDIFQTVKMLRTQRPATVQTEDQYQFCYRASLEYLGSFDHYAT